MAADEAELSRAVWTRPLWSPWCRRWWGWAGIGAEARVDLLQIDFRQLETRLDVWTLWLTGHVLTLRDRNARKPLRVCVCEGTCGSEYEFLVNEHVVNVFIETLALGKQAVRVNQLSVTSHPVSCRQVLNTSGVSASNRHISSVFICLFLLFPDWPSTNPSHLSCSGPDTDFNNQFQLQIEQKSDGQEMKPQHVSPLQDSRSSWTPFLQLYNKISDCRLFLSHLICAEV